MQKEENTQRCEVCGKSFTAEIKSTAQQRYHKGPVYVCSCGTEYRVTTSGKSIRFERIQKNFF